MEWGDGNHMKYPMLNTNSEGKLLICPICSNEETNVEGDYCQICGTELRNSCPLFNCQQNYLPSNARYCPICGSKSSFYENNILKEWNYNTNLVLPFGDEELPFH